ncbi:acetyl-CoA carboxylase biotin carboxyl carrier protein subunit [Bosea sp. UC22_33]|uniref:acetyl-CoA carboxylase biotin carboxyl carrier protein subunit n=1 Tax=Bosea sp. UC22_33 TaxID=3350165 RepID=UPI00366B261C
MNAEIFELTFADRLLRGSHATTGERVRLTLEGETFTIGIGSEARPAAAAGSGGAGSGAILAPMPGVVAEVRVAPGDTVEAGQVVVVLESMKLFTSLSAGIGGVVTDIAYQQGDTVQAGKRVLLIEPSSRS